jgi:uncharacterized cupredoxin-like copper-binding protein
VKRTRVDDMPVQVTGHEEGAQLTDHPWRSSRISEVVGGAAAATILAMAGFLWQSVPGQSAPATIQLTAKEFLYEPKEVRSSPGEVIFVVKNGGAIEHNFVLEDQAKKRRTAIPIVEPAQTLEAKASLETGTYTIYCSIPGHKEAGMVAALVVLP